MESFANMANADRKKCKYLAVVLVDTAVVTSLSFRPRGMVVVVRRSLAQYKAHPVRNLDRALLCKRHSQTVSRASSSTVADTRTGLAGRERGNEDCMQRMRLIISGHGIAARLPTAGHESVAWIARGTLAHGDVAAGFALCIHTALILARINALVVAAGPMVRAVLVHLTLALCPNEWKKSKSEI